MNYILFDDFAWNNLLPLTFTRPVSETRVGILTIREKWEKRLSATCFNLTQPYLQKKFNLIKSIENTIINGSIIPTDELVKAILNLKMNQSLVKNDVLIAAKLSENRLEEFQLYAIKSCNTRVYPGEITKIEFPYQLFSLNGQEISNDFQLITKGKKSAKLSKTNNILNGNNIFVEDGAIVEYATINTTGGFVYIGKDAHVMEGSIIHGSAAFLEHSVVKIGAKIYGPTTIGPYSKVGGEINNSVIFGYSNKGHDGFLGNSVLGHWCNLGADTNTSNLKNNYADVKLWNYPKERFLNTGLQFCGLIMGDHSKCGINTMFNTGTVVGVNTNIYGSGFPRNFVPSFAWGGALGFMEYKLPRAFEAVERMMTRRDMPADSVEKEKEILASVFNETIKYRNFT